MLVLPAKVDIAVFSTLFKDKSLLVSDILLPSIVFASVNLAKSLSTGVPLVSTVPVLVVYPAPLVIALLFNCRARPHFVILLLF